MHVTQDPSAALRRDGTKLSSREPMLLRKMPIESQLPPWSARPVQKVRRWLATVFSFVRSRRQKRIYFTLGPSSRLLTRRLQQDGVTGESCPAAGNAPRQLAYRLGFAMTAVRPVGVRHGTSSGQRSQGQIPSFQCKVGDRFAIRELRPSLSSKSRRTLPQGSALR